MTTIAEVRQQYPQYMDMSDEQLAKALHGKFYSDIPYDDFAGRIGLKTVEKAPEKPSASVGGVAAEAGKGFLRGASNTAQLIPEGMLSVLGPYIKQQVMEGLKSVAAPSRSLVVANPQNTAEQMASTGGEIAGGVTAGGFAGGTVGQVAKNVFLPAAGGAVGEQLAGETGKIIGSVAPGAIEAMVPLAAKTLKSIVVGTGDRATAAAQRLETLDRAGVSATLEDVAPNRAFLEKTMAKAPGAQILQNRAIDRQAEEMKASIEKLIPEASATPSSAGQAVKEGLSQWKEEFFSTWRKLDEKTRSLLGNGPVAAESTKETLVKLSQKIDDPVLNDIFQNPQIAAMRKTIVEDKGGIVDLNTLIQLRREIGQQAANSFSQMKSNMAAGELKALYGSLSKDIERAAETTNPAALEALKKQNAYYAAGSQRISTYYGKLAKQADPDRVFSMLEGQARTGATGIQTVMKALPQDSRDEVISAVLQKMGKAKASVQDASGSIFSPETLLTNWNKYSPEAKRALFAGSSNPELMTSMDRLASASQILRESNKVLGNPSGTGAVLTNYGTLGALIFKPVATMSIIGSSAAGVYLMTNPQFLRWAVSATKIDPGQMAAHVAKLGVIANASKDDQFKDAVRKYADALEK